MTEGDSDKQLQKQSIQDLLTQAAAYVQPAADRKPWDYGWSVEEYRSSSAPAFSCNGEVYTILPDGIKYYEVAVTKLEKLPDIRSAWDLKSFWGTVASGVAFIALAEDRSARSEDVVKRLRNASPSLVALSLANIGWDGSPICFSFGVLGMLDSDYIETVNSIAGKNHVMQGSLVDRWIKEITQEDTGAEYEPTVDDDASKESNAKESSDSELEPCGCTPGEGHPPSRPVIWSTWVPGQDTLAYKQAERQLENLVGVTLLLEMNAHTGHISMASGSTNRPGIRGLTLDRGAIESLLIPGHSSEIVASTLIVSSLGGSPAHMWESANPIPLSKLLSQSDLKTDVEQCLADDNPVTRRIKVAARWFMEAKWASQKDDAALALCVALDSLVGSRGGLPGRAVRERFAFLEPTAALRDQRAARYDEIFSVRSSVAHGGSSNKLDETDFIHLIAKDVSWAAHRMLTLYRSFKPNSDRDLDAVFDGIRWGTVSWPGVKTEA